MQITNNKTLADIQNEFNAKFHYLKLEFYSQAHKTNIGSPESEKLNPQHTIDEARTKHVLGDLSIDGYLKVSTLENTFHEKYGLNVQVFRRSGNIWLQTTATDDWSLADQNKKGKESMQ